VVAIQPISRAGVEASARQHSFYGTSLLPHHDATPGRGHGVKSLLEYSRRFLCRAIRFPDSLGNLLPWDDRSDRRPRHLRHADCRRVCVPAPIAAEGIADFADHGLQMNKSDLCTRTR